MAENVLKNKNFTLLFLGAFVSNIGGIFYNFAVSFHILDITNKNAKIQGLYLAVCGLMFLIATPFGGALADRLNKAKIVYLTDFIRGAVILFSGFAIFFVKSVLNELIILFITAAILNIIGAIFSPAASSLVRFVVKENQIQQAQSYFSMLNSIQSIIGVILAGILVSIFSINNLFYIIGILYLLSGLSEIFIRYHYEKSQNYITVHSMVIDYLDGIKYLKTQKAITTLLFGVLLINFFTNPIFSNGVSYFVKTYLDYNYLFKTVLKTPEMWASVFNVAISIGTFITALIISSRPDKGRYAQRMKKWIFLIGLIITLMAISLNVFVFYFNKTNIHLIVNTFLMILLGITIVGFNIPTITAVQIVVDRDKLAKVHSLITIGSLGLTPLSALVGGLIISEIGLGVLYIVCSLGVLFSAVFISSNKKINKMGIKE